MVVHFICRGNTHRSRLAEAFAKSSARDLSSVSILSSGIEADGDMNGAIMPFVELLLRREGLLQFTGPTWTQTTQPLIDSSDVLVFMSDGVYRDAMDRFWIPPEKSRRWQIPDTQGVDEQIRSAVRDLLSELVL
jgi:protein-tyrosine-phosphatase